MSYSAPSDFDRLVAGDSGRLDVGGVRRHQIVMAVRKLIATEGAGSVTIARIAAVMGTSRGVVNHHFKNKEEILRAALQSAAKDASAATDQIVAESTDLGSITALVVRLASTASDWWHVYIAFLAEATHDDFAKTMIQESDRSFRANLGQTLGDDARAAVVLALMKGLALQRVVDATFDTEGALTAASELLAPWRGANP
ncbi:MULTISPECIES: TetR/AcrR family transcriptional regulator [Rhodococcus]|uniref:TetR/AcrR family transcriptional regulator n=1 Tax=Rhodococcus TaxID=1827 RepID=UPI00146AA28C|nr:MULTISPECIES: TetR/AcrR family transcriptional regulator [Rhodococcus]MDI9935272.1 TetR/AcrR family transcriptional regulator [Rhodococcus sp. IEGM 1351]MDJ0414310.1 TetR/AcrR family transcriptional regulator [Rhodococcus opacus]WKN57520.1 TetR/AcrR family transcriptional regulator [Rhodococcus opacus]